MKLFTASESENGDRIQTFGELEKLGANSRVELYVAEEQEMLREAYQSFFLPQSNIEVVGSSGDTTGDSLVQAISALNPDVMLLGLKILQPATVEKLEMIRESCPDVAIVLLSSYYDVKGIRALREFSRGGSVGCAYLLKHTIDTVDQLTRVMCSVAEGRYPQRVCKQSSGVPSL